jgi:hypothetical protein
LGLTYTTQRALSTRFTEKTLVFPFFHQLGGQAFLKTHSLNMKNIPFFLIPVLGTGFFLGATAFSDTISYALPSDAEADSIVRDEADARREAETNRAIHRIDWDVLAETERRRHDGTRLILRRVAPPDLPEPRETPATRPELTEFERDIIREFDLSPGEFQHIRRYGAKEHEVLSLSVTVFDRKISRLRWQYDGNDFTAWSTIDFNYLRGLRQFDTETHVYSLFMGIGEVAPGSPEYLNANVPVLPPATEGRAQYFVETADPALLEDDRIFAPLDALHDHYETNEAHLKHDYERRRILNEARRRHREANPAQPQDTVIHFWRKDGLD